MAEQQELRVVLRTIAETRGADQVTNSLRQVRQQAQGTREAGLERMFSLSGESALRFAGALTGVEIGLSLAASAGRALRDVLSADVFIESQRTARAIAASYGENAEQFIRFSSALAAQTGFTKQSVLESALTVRTLSREYGLSIEQTQRLITASADLARIRGFDLADATKRVSDAVRGEAESAEQLGLVLNADFLAERQRVQGISGSFIALNQSQRAQVAYTEALRQSAQFAGLASQAAEGIEGAQLRAAQATQDLSNDLGQLLSRQLEITTNQFTDLTRAIDEFVKTANQGTADERRARQALETRRQIGELLVQVGITQNRFGLLFDASTQKMLNVEELADRLRVSWDDLLAVMEQGQDAFSGSAEGLELVRRAVERTKPPVDQLAVSIVRVDETLRSADAGAGRLSRELAVLSSASGDASALVTNLGEGLSTATQRAALAAENDLRRILSATQALNVSTLTSLRQQEEIASQVSDPRDAIGGSNRIARERIQILDQLEPLERRLIDARQEHNDLQRESIQLAAQEAAAQLQSLPATERLQDLQNSLSRARLVASDRFGQPVDARIAARQQVRALSRQLPSAELAAFDADQRAEGVRRAQTRNRLLGSIATGAVAERQEQIDVVVQGTVEIRVTGEGAGTLSDEARQQLSTEVVAMFHSARLAAENAASRRLAGAG